MSLLLEALKKSDQQRRKQVVPDLETVHAPAAEPRRSNLLRNLGVVALVIAAIGVGWLLKPSEAPDELVQVMAPLPARTPQQADSPSQVKPTPRPSQPAQRLAELRVRPLGGPVEKALASA